jgi:hypothetical protein
VDPNSIAWRLRVHRRAWWWPRHCRCGSAYPCNARRTALDEQVRDAARAAVDWYPAYFADHDPDLAEHLTRVPRGRCR